MIKLINLYKIDNSKIEIYILENKIFLQLPKNCQEADFSVKDMNGCLVSYGWIDSHTHCNIDNKLYKANIDEIGFKTGVTTLIDAGSVGVNDIEKMFNFAKNSITNLKILLNISKSGIYEQSELKNIKDLCFEFDSKYNDFIVGYKARMSKSVVINTGIEPLKMFSQYRDRNNIQKPLMVHIGNEPPEFRDLVDLLNSGDIVTHIFNYKNRSIFDNNFNKTINLQKAIDKGIIFDVGHGSESFNYKCALNSFKNEFKTNIISTDIYEENIKNLKVKSLSSVMSKFKSIGYSWKEIIDAVTIAPVKAFGFKKMGLIEDEAIANLTFFTIEINSSFEIDSNENKILINERIKPVGCIVNGKYYEV